MTTFDEREDTFEKKFVLDEELMFKAQARRNKLLGLWAAAKLGLAGEAAEAYAKELVITDIAQNGDEDVIARLRADFNAKPVAVSDKEITAAMAEFMAKAVDQIKAGV